MLLLIAALQAVVLVILLVLLVRKPAAAPVDTRMQQVPDALVSLAGRMQAADEAQRAVLAELRREQAETALRGQAAAVEAARHLREEVHGRIEVLSATLNTGFAGFRADHAAGTDKLREQVNAALREIDGRMQAFARETAAAHTTAQEALHGRLNGLSDKNQQSHDALRDVVQSKLTELGATNQQSHDALREGVQIKLAEFGTKNQQSHDALREGVHTRLSGLGEQQREHHERMSGVVQQRLDKLNQDNTAKLEEMRTTVDEKLNSTLNERLTASFGQVSEHLGQVQKGLGEMKEFATGVSDLKKVFSNVKARGIVGEFQLGQQLEQMFSAEQYVKNVAMKPGSAERVDYALKVPQGRDGSGSATAYFPIDAKFPREDWERLEHAYEAGNADEIAAAGKSFEGAIRAQAKSICAKYIHEPETLPHAIMFLPTEGLYAEVMRRPGLQQDLQHQCNVTIAGPSTLMAILTSFRMGFHTIAMERKGHEIEKVLGKVKTEFTKFGGLIDKVEKQVGTVQNTLGDIRGKTTTIARSLRGVTELAVGVGDELDALPFDGIAGVLPMNASTESEAVR